MRVIRAFLFAGLLVALAGSPRVEATTVKHFDLSKMTTSAARVFRGVVTDIRAGSVKLGGGELPTTIYRIRISETFKGEFQTAKNITYADVTMIGSVKGSQDKNGIRHFEIFRDMPQLQVGQDYLVFLTAESRSSLSSPVGLAQGLFKIDADLPSQPTTNGLNNAGLVAGRSSGPMPYSDIASRVRALIAGKKGE